MRYTTNNGLIIKDKTDNYTRENFNKCMNIIDNGISKFFVATESSTNVYKVTTGLNKTSLVNGYSVKVAIPTNSTGAVSLVIDSCSAVAIKKPNGNAVTNFKQNGVYNLTYYNSVFILASGGVDDVNFSASDLLTGKTANDSNGEKVNGTMPNNGAKTATLNCGGSYTIPAGYHNGSGKVTANSLSSQTSANATAKDIIKGKTAWVNGSKITGTATIQSLGGKNYKEGTTGDISNTTPVTINLSFVPKVIEAIRYNSSGNVSGKYFVDYEKLTYLKNDGTSTNETTVINNTIVVSGTSVTFKRYNVSSGDVYYEYRIWG